VDPYDIPNGYCPTKHAALSKTIATPGDLGSLGSAGMHLMACHESNKPGKEIPCVGWLVQQLGHGNNIALRLRVLGGQIDANVETVGPQHASLKDTLRRLTPKGK
jgi:hypothetical protein